MCRFTADVAAAVGYIDHVQKSIRKFPFRTLCILRLFFASFAFMLLMLFHRRPEAQRDVGRARRMREARDDFVGPLAVRVAVLVLGDKMVATLEIFAAPVTGRARVGMGYTSLALQLLIVRGFISPEEWSALQE